MNENQGVCRWAVQLDGSDDPPVLVEVDRAGPSSWELYAERFSVFVYAFVWDYGKVFSQPCRTWTSVGHSVGPHLAQLRRSFREGPHTYGWPTDTTYRFASEEADLFILIWDEPEKTTDWWLTADGPAALIKLLERLWGWGMLTHELDPLDDCAVAVLKHATR